MGGYFNIYESKIIKAIFSLRASSILWQVPGQKPWESFRREVRIKKYIVSWTYNTPYYQM